MRKKTKDYIATIFLLSFIIIFSTVMIYVLFFGTSATIGRLDMHEVWETQVKVSYIQVYDNSGLFYETLADKGLSKYSYQINQTLIFKVVFKLGNIERSNITLVERLYQNGEFEITLDVFKKGLIS